MRNVGSSVFIEKKQAKAYTLFKMIQYFIQKSLQLLCTWSVSRLFI